MARLDVVPWSRASTRPCSLTALAPERAPGVRSGFQLGADAVEGLADHLLRRALDEAGSDAGERSADVDVSGPGQVGGVRALRRQLHRGRGIDGTAGRLTVRLDGGGVGLVQVG